MKKATYNFLQSEVKKNWNLVLQDCPTGVYFFLVEKGKEGRVKTLCELSDKWDKERFKPNFEIIAAAAKENNFRLNYKNLDRYCNLLEKKIEYYFKVKTYAL